MKLDRVEAAVIIGLGVALALFVLAGLQMCSIGAGSDQRPSRWSGLS